MQIEYRAGNRSSGVLPHLQHLIGVAGNTAVAVPGMELCHSKVSAVIITYNEEIIIRDTLSRLWWCDEIVIIDSGSTDRTIEYCRQFGCRIITRKFKGFGDQKKFGVSEARNNWILCIDADEILTEPLIDEIRRELAKDKNEFAAFAVPRNLVFMQKVFVHGKESGSPIIRLFNKRKANWDGAVVHEKVTVNGATKNLTNKILHYSYHDYSQFVGKINLYSTLMAKKLMERNKRKSRLLVILALPFNFFRYYVIDRNFLNGYRGFAWSVLNTGYHFVKYLKLEELRKFNKYSKN